MKKFVAAYAKIPLILKIAVAIVIGAVLGVYLPQASFVSVFGERSLKDMPLFDLNLAIHYLLS